MKPSKADRAAWAAQSVHEVIKQIEVEHGVRTASSSGPAAEAVGEGAPQAISVARGPAIVTRDPRESQVGSPAELATEPARAGKQKTGNLALTAPAIRPAGAESLTLLSFPKVSPPSPAAPRGELPIEVRIGRVEVRAPTAPTLAPAKSGATTPVGFDGYYRVRNYRN
jgi:hypothetical protein